MESKSIANAPNTFSESYASAGDVRAIDEDAFLEQSKPALEELEIIRLAKLKAYEFRKRIALPFVSLLTPAFGYLDYLLLWWQQGNDDSGAGVTFLFLGMVYWWVTGPQREYAKAYKLRILPRIASLFGPFTYQHDGKLDMAKLAPSRILPHYQRVKSEDYFKGQYKGVDIEFSEMTLTYTSGSGKSRRTVVSFKGLVILLEMERKKFLGHTIVEKNKGTLLKWVQKLNLKLEPARMADPEFEKLFDAYTNDQVEARYLLDPVIIERVKQVYDEYVLDDNRERLPREKSWVEYLRLGSEDKGTPSLKLAFYDGLVLLLIGSKHNHFEPAHLGVPATDPQSLLHMKQEIGSILSLIDQLELYERKYGHTTAISL
jgi:hypothetical protein